MLLTVKPVFVKNNIEYAYSTDEYSYVVAVLQQYLGENLNFTYENGIFDIHVDEASTLQRIYHYSGKRFLYDKELYEDGAFLKFEILRYN
jgi:hypothetical protein